MRLIEADKVEKITWQEPKYNDPLNVLTEVREKIRELPTVDAEPVIRCKDCKYAVDEYDDGDCYCDKDNLGYIGKDWNHYCSWAERKEE